ncbi:MAG: HNH endonuclease [Deltaproteobacteria bacterium]|nr:HNH endonuclease [Deltaproteobacteria bacterium]
MDDWKTLIGNLHTWKRGKQRAVHKPLLTLLLLARAQQGQSNQVSYEEVDGPMHQALVNFAPPRKKVQTFYPFWHLQTDGFWKVLNADQIPDSPTRGKLLHHHAIGMVPAKLWAQLGKHQHLIPELSQQLLDDFWPDTYHDDIRSFFGLDEMTTSISKRKRDPRFRDSVMLAYEHRCAICGFDGRLGNSSVGLEAAHIKFHTDGGPDVVPNGLALCALHHKLFDRGALGLEPEKNIILVSKLLIGHDTVADVCLRYKNKPIRSPQDPIGSPKPDFVRWHRKNVFQEPARV